MAVTVEEKDQAATEKVLEIMKTWVDAEAENTAFLVKAHPRGKQALVLFADKVNAMIRSFLVDEILPEIHVMTKEEAEKAMGGFWANRTEVVTRKRAKQS